jgi:hypothetical protein
MDRTPIRAKFVKRLITINDQLCFAALGRREFGETLSKLVKASPKDFTTSVFPANPYAPRIYRKMKDMPAFAAKSEQIELQMCIIAGFEHALAYVEELEDFRASVRPSHADATNVDAPEDRLLAKMTQWMGGASEKGPYKTFGYVRLLRNHYAHVNDEKTPAFSSYIANHAHQLQRFWDNGITDLGGIKFRTLPDGPLSAESAFAVMNLLRVSIEMIDRDYAGTLKLADILETTAAEVFVAAAHHDRALERMGPKVRATLKRDYGEEFDLTAVREGVNAFLAAQRHRKSLATAARAKD